MELEQHLIHRLDKRGYLQSILLQPIVLLLNLSYFLVLIRHYVIKVLLGVEGVGT